MSLAPPPLRLPERPQRRVERRRRARRDRRSRLITLVGAVLASLVVVAAALFAVVDAATTDDPVRDPLAGSDEGVVDDAAPAAPERRVALLAQAGTDGVAASLTILTPTHVVLVPPGAMAEVPSFGLDTLGRALALGGAPLLQATVENLLGVGVDELVVADDATLGSLVAPAGDLTVDVPERVEAAGPRGAVDVLWEAGPTLVSPDDVGRLLSAEGESNDLGRLARHEAFWRSWLRAMRDAAAVPDGDLGRYLAVLARDGAQIDVLPVETLDAGASGDEVYRVREDELDALVRRAMPDAAALDGSRPRVQILNGTGGVGVAQDVTLRLVQPPLRARVLYTGNADSFEHGATQVVIYDRAHEAIGAQVRDALGAGRVVLSRRPLGIVDVTVVVGRDFG